MKNEIIKRSFKSIEINYKDVNEAVAGEIIGFNVKPYEYTNHLYIRKDNNFLVFKENVMNNIKIAENLRVKILMTEKTEL